MGVLQFLNEGNRGAEERSGYQEVIYIVSPEYHRLRVPDESVKSKKGIHSIHVLHVTVTYVQDKKRLHP